MHNHQCGCGTMAEMLMLEEAHRFPGSYRQFAAGLHPTPAPQAVRTEGFEPYAVLTGTVQTLSRQGLREVPSVPLRREQQPTDYVQVATHAPAPVVARSGLALMIGTVFRRAVQYVKSAAPNPAPVQNYGLLRINDLLDPEHRALEMPRYHFAQIDSAAMLDRARIAAQMMLNTGQAGGGP